MTYQEAIETIKSNYPPENYTMLRESLDMSMELLKKQIPIAPIRRDWDPSKCPNCGAELGESLEDGYYKDWESKKICDCGQKLDWKLKQ